MPTAHELRYAPIGALLMLLLPSCEGGGAGSQNPPAPAASADPVHAEAPVPNPSPAVQHFAAADATFEVFLKRFPPLALPADFPPEEAIKRSALQRKLERPDVERFVCGTRYLKCKLEEERQEVFALGQIPISSNAVAVVVMVIGDVDTPLAILTYSPKGEVLGGHLVGGNIGDAEYGYSGKLEADGRSLSVNRYVWVQGTEKEYVEDLSFVLSDDGGLTRVIR